MGIKKYFTPASAPGLVTEYAVIKKESTTRIGIIIFETRSMPLRTPAKIMPRVSMEKIKKHSSVDAPSEIKLLK